LATEQPFLLVVGGPNGSGKTTLTSQLRADGVDFGRYINPDDIATTLTGEYGDRVRQAQALADAQRAACIDAGESFSFETVMSHPSKIEVMRLARRRVFAWRSILSLQSQSN
jgi:predicted ABC-type ATPase